MSDATARLEACVARLEALVGKLESSDSDKENRIRSLEQFKWKAMGVCLALSGVWAVLVKFL